MEAKIVENVARNEVILNNCAEILDKKEINMRINENEHTIEISLKNMFSKIKINSFIKFNSQNISNIDESFLSPEIKYSLMLSINIFTSFSTFERFPPEDVILCNSLYKPRKFSGEICFSES